MTQKELVINQLEEVGYVSRNWALRNYISRLGAIMYELKDWYEVCGKYIENDYIYVITS